MGEVIRKTAAAEDILTDVRKTLTSATAKQGEWQTDAEARLGPVVVLADNVDERVKEQRKVTEPAVAQLDVANRESDDLIGRTADDFWNDIGRPAVDVTYDIMYPGGIRSIVDGAVDDQPYRMELLAELFEAKLHPKLPADKATGYATAIRQSATRLEERVDAARPLKARLEMLERMQTAIARSGAVALSRLKRKWLSDGHTEAEIHTVIPDRSSSKNKGGGGGGGGGPTGA